MNAKVLLVDDNSTVIKIIGKYLEEEGIEVFSTQESSEAVKMACDVLPDIILLDILMPGLDGFEVCRLLKHTQAVADIPVIILTAETDSRDVKKAMELGAADYIRKPADKVEIIARVQSAYRIKQYQDELKEMAIKDGLTGLYNRTYLLGQLETQLSVQALDTQTISFVMIDIDYFKKINDTHGHAAGDSVLRAVSGIFTSVIGDTGIVGRYGGEEFGIILPGLTLQDAGALCEKIRKNVEDHDFGFGGKKIAVTVSLGLCSRKISRVTGYDQLLKTADDALYLAKKNGRNRVEIDSLGD